MVKTTYHRKKYQLILSGFRQSSLTDYIHRHLVKLNPPPPSTHPAPLHPMFLQFTESGGSGGVEQFLWLVRVG